MKYLLGLIVVLCVFLQACAHHVSKSSKAAHKIKSAAHANIAQLAREQHSDKNKADVNSEHDEFAEEGELAEEAVKDWTIPENDRLYFELSGEKYENLNSQQVYGKIIEKYRSNDLKAIEAYTTLLLVKYPQSRFADNALYLQGMFAFSIKSYAKSLESFQKLITLYPNGNKAVSALFAKGILYKKMNLRTESENVLSNVKVKYPGSPESLRADAEIKILKQ